MLLASISLAYTLEGSAAACKKTNPQFFHFYSYLFIKELTIYTLKMFLKLAIFLLYIWIPLILGQKHFGTVETEQPIPNNAAGTGSIDSSEKSPPYYDGPVASNSGQLFTQIDTNGDGKISLPEATHWFARLANRMEPDVLGDEEFRAVFNQVDIDGDGFVQPWELDMAVNMLMPKGQQQPQQL